MSSKKKEEKKKKQQQQRLLCDWSSRRNAVQGIERKGAVAGALKCQSLCSCD